MATTPAYYIGLMSGTSLDGVDVVLAEIDLPDHFSLIAAKTYPIPEQLRQALLDLSQKEQHHELDIYAELDVRMGQLFAQSCLSIIHEQQISAAQVYAIGSHGQTLRHYPETPYPTTLQIGDPNIIAQETGITTIADFRRRDMAVGGQGAPLVPPFHQAFFSNRPGSAKNKNQKQNKVILNIGGIANITFLAAGQENIIGYDTGPGNGLMDNWCEKHFNCAYDHAGKLASQGQVNKALLSQMLQDSYFSQAYPKSTGREYFSAQWVEAQLQKFKQGTEALLTSSDVLSTLLQLTCVSISNEIKQLEPGVDEVLVCGGGVKNVQLMSRLAALLPEISIHSTEIYGLHPDWVEASAFAWLAQQTLNGLTSNHPNVTGADKKVILGAIWQA